MRVWENSGEDNLFFDQIFLLRFSDIERKDLTFFLKLFSGVVKTAIYVSIATFWRQIIHWKTLFFQINFAHSAKKFSAFCGTFSVWLIKLHSSCPWEHLMKNKLFENVIRYFKILFGHWEIKILALGQKSSASFFKIAFYVSTGIIRWKISVSWPKFFERFLGHWAKKCHRFVWIFSAGSSQLHSMFSWDQLEELHFSTESYLFWSLLDSEQKIFGLQKSFFDRVVKTSFYLSREIFCVFLGRTKIFRQVFQNCILRVHRNNLVKYICFVTKFS